ncbi:hypothetical protein V2J09_015809 [Rumex salicifolius]
MEENSKKLPLHVIKEANKLSSAINITHTLIHTLCLCFLLHYRISVLLNDGVSIPCLLLFLAELLLSLFWLSQRAYRWRPIDRVVFIDRLGPEDEIRLPAVDVIVCTADPNKEPTVEVMNTVVSAMALDYPADKLHVYLSDDGGSHVTLAAMREAWAFATWWVPFCRRYGVECRCPMAYFQDEDEDGSCGEFYTDRLLLKERYEEFKKRVELNLRRKNGQTEDDSRNNHGPLVQVIDEGSADPSIVNPAGHDIPQLIYVAREKRPSYPHNFKAGALNVLLRVSGLISNSPIVLVLDCDMYCNDPTSAKQAMCFYMDPQISSSLAFVQFPQRFHNVSKHDLYDSGLRLPFKELWKGVDGLNMGPILSGTGFYINRKALYFGCLKGVDLVQSRNEFGSSNEFIKTLRGSDKFTSADISPEALIREAEFVASRTYEKDTQWGEGVGFFYHSLVEDFMTGYNLHCRGWKSMYLDPKRDPFLGTTTTNLNDVLTQTTRWLAGLVEVGFSKFCPLIYGPSRRGLSLLQRSCYVWISLYPVTFLSAWCFAFIPQLCLLHGIPVYPKVSSMSFQVVLFIFLSSLMKHLHEVLTTGGTIASWWNECRMWKIRMLTSYTYGTLDAFMKVVGLKKTSFIPTNKVIDEEQAKRYYHGLYDFQTSNMFLVPLGTAVILNLACFIRGSTRMIVARNWDEMAMQVLLSGYLLVLSKPIIEGMIVRKDKGSFPAYATTLSLFASLMLLSLGPIILLH